MATFNSLICFLLACVFFFETVASYQMVGYWGQQSVNDELPLASYCTDSTYDVIVIGFVFEFPFDDRNTQFPALNLADHCGDSFSGLPNLLSCPQIGQDIVTCQNAGKKILISLGGGEGTYGFSSDAQAQTFATVIWNMFLGGSSNSVPRPFGSAILDGVDLDIEGGRTTGYVAFITALRSNFGSAKQYYISSAPQCPFPDGFLGPGTGTALQSGWFDYVWVQFYNNFCGLNVYGTSEFNFNSWATWARETSINPNVKVFIGAPAGPRAAGSGYVAIDQLITISNAMASTYPDVYGGVMVWDAGTALDNGDFSGVMARTLHSSGSSSSTPASSTSSPHGSSTSASHGSTSSTSASHGSTTSASHGSTSSTSASHGSTSSTTGHHGSTSSTTGPHGSSSTSTTGKHSSSSTTTTGKHSSSSTSTSSSGSGSSGSGSSGSSVSSGNVDSSTDTTCAVVGYQRCVGTSMYQTCTPTRADNIWSASQSCQSGLSCHPSATANNIYCY